MAEFRIPQEEEKILNFWQKNKIFERTLKQARDYSFYDGPPFATGKPHYGHILASSIKDVVCRFFSQRGFRVERRVGWDCHGLPVENLVEKKLGIKSKKDIEKLGIAKFNSACRKAVTKYVKDFERTLTRLGRWADYKNAYFTMNQEYIESVWWVFKQIHNLGLLYQGVKVTAYCPRCGTPLSNLEVNLGYKRIKDISIYVLFKVKNQKNTYFLVWTTTPWTLTANLALAVGNFTYVKIRLKDKIVILAKDRLKVIKEKYKILKELKAQEIIGLEYEPLYYYPKALKGSKKGIYRVYQADFVNLEEGTGIVHIAPAFGEEDMELGKENNLPILVSVNSEGKSIFGPGKGKWIKDADKEIKKDLYKRGLLYKEEKIRHKYPFCWRCDTPLLYYPLTTFFIKVSALREKLLKNNEKIHWVPGYLKHGRFGKWLADAKDWAVSRNRYWGAPLPVFRCKKCAYEEVIGSIKELKDKGAAVPKDLHRPFIDKVSYKCPKCKSQMRRVEEVFDCWFESGSMPYAQFHYPFEDKNKTENKFPADFIAEGLDQTRGWFYTLHVIATILTLKDLGLGKNKPAFLNVVVNGIILAEDGKKLSKRLKNYPDPNEIFNKYGADALRLFLISSAPLGENYRFSERLVKLIYQSVILRLYNSFLFLDYTAKSYKLNKFQRPQKLSLLDQWIYSRLDLAYQRVINLMEKYELAKASREIIDFVADLSQWYIRRVKSEIKDKKTASAKCYVLRDILRSFVILSAPFLPYLSETIFQKIKYKNDPLSVHIVLIKERGKPNKQILDQMQKLRLAISQLLELRAKHKIKVRQPIGKAIVPWLPSSEEASIIKSEINAKEVKKGKEFYLDTKITQALLEEGLLRETTRQIQAVRKKMGIFYGQKAQFKILAPLKLKQFLNKNLKHLCSKTNSQILLGKGKEEIGSFKLLGEKIRIFKLE